MNFSPQTKAWLLLVTLVLATGVGVFTTSYAGGCKWWLALVSALGASAMSVYHALSKSPSDTPDPPANPAKP